MDLSYETEAHHEKFTRLLLLMNVETVRRLKNSTERYSFRQHRGEEWSLEHNLGDNQLTRLDGRCCRFLGIRYADLRERTLAGGADEELLVWAHAHGTPRTDEECHIWNRFILKVGWRDERSAVLPQRIRDSGLGGKPIETIVDHIEYDEGRDPVATRAWDSI